MKISGSNISDSSIKEITPSWKIIFLLSLKLILQVTSWSICRYLLTQLMILVLSVRCGSFPAWKFSKLWVFYSRQFPNIISLRRTNSWVIEGLSTKNMHSTLRKEPSPTATIGEIRYSRPFQLISIHLPSPILSNFTKGNSFLIEGTGDLCLHRDRCLTSLVTGCLITRLFAFECFLSMHVSCDWCWFTKLQTTWPT